MLKGTMRHVPYCLLYRGEITTQCRTFSISGRTNPSLSKSHIKNLRPFRDKSNWHLSNTPARCGRPQGDIHATEMTRVYNGDARKARDNGEMV